MNPALHYAQSVVYQIPILNQKLLHLRFYIKVLHNYMAFVQLIHHDRLSDPSKKELGSDDLGPIAGRH